MKKCNIIKVLISLFVVILCSLNTYAQIGYQVSLLNSATGEPRANENVKVKIEITNSDNTVICSEEKDATSNEFGVLSLSVGNDKTFEDVDWSKAPFYVSATIDGSLIGKSQILSVPIAEAAKTLVNISPDLLSGTWRSESVTLTFSFSDNKSGHCTMSDPDKGSYHYTFEIEGNTIWCYKSNGYGYCMYMRYHNGRIYQDGGSFHLEQAAADK